MSFFARLIVTTLAALISAYLLPGVNLDNVLSAIILALVLSLLNTIVRPLLILLTLPITVITLGFFLIVINALMIMLAARVVPGFSVDGFWWALFFGLILSITVTILESIAGFPPNNRQ